MHFTKKDTNNEPREVKFKENNIFIGNIALAHVAMDHYGCSLNRRIKVATQKATIGFFPHFLSETQNL